jgi:hypothetical protein
MGNAEWLMVNDLSSGPLISQMTINLLQIYWG